MAGFMFQTFILEAATHTIGMSFSAHRALGQGASLRYAFSPGDRAALDSYQYSVIPSYRYTGEHK